MVRFLVHLGKPLRLGDGRLSIGEPVTMFMACHGFFVAGFVARFVIVYGLLRGHCMTCLRVSLLD